MSLPSSVLLVADEGPVKTLTINRPEAFNALSDAVVATLTQAIRAAEASPSCRVVVITGAGDRAFCAGADLKQLDGLNLAEARAVMRDGQELMRSIAQATVPVICAVNGLALGGGFELVLSATFAILSTGASLGLPESALGLIPGYGGTQLLPRLIGGASAAHLMLTGARLDAQRAHQLGMTPVAPVAPEALMPTVKELAGTIAAQGPAAVKSILAALDAGRRGPLDAGLELEADFAARAIAGAESSEGISAFLQRRPAVFADAGEDPA